MRYHKVSGANTPGNNKIQSNALAEHKHHLNNVCPKCMERPSKSSKTASFPRGAKDLGINRGLGPGRKCAEDSKCKNYRHSQVNSPSVQKTMQTVLMRGAWLSSFGVRAFVYRPDPGTPRAVAALHTGRTTASKKPWL